MTLKIAVQMDPIEAIDVAGDSTFALMLEAQARGHQLFEYHADTLALRAGKLSATGADVKVRDEAGSHFEKSENRNVQLDEYDAVLMRQDPPFDMNYITYTHMLEAIHPKTLVVNDPAEVRNAPEKLYVLQYNEFIPPTLISRDPQRLSDFRDEYGDIILKPLYGNGGAGVFRLAHGDENFASLMEMFTQSFREPFIAQQYLSDVKQGDKRIILVDGEPVGAINRVPAAGETRSNMHVGGRPEPTELTDREREICARIGPDLKKRGLIFVGIDVIGDYMTEINVTSPTGIREVKKFGGADIAALVMDAVEARRG
ncbi:glutathione synthase [Anderseniella sp. Alg231-50]|uniref:glutathione synthase n=1 Tax=Anderseniella sp. Alg231-50 TaxID=1922226 RepID=UPI000D550A34